MRPVAIGRKNWIHVGSPQAGPKIAAILSVVESCRRLKLPVRDYLAAVLPGLADRPIRRLPDLTPAASPSIHRLKRQGCWGESDFSPVTWQLGGDERASVGIGTDEGFLQRPGKPRIEACDQEYKCENNFVASCPNAGSRFRD